MNRLARPLLLLCLLLPLGALAVEGEQARPWHRLVGILQYLEADYPLAVQSQSAFELAEQRAFAAEAVAAAAQLGPQGERFMPRVRALQEKVLRGADPAEVSRECGQLVEELVQAGGLARAPRKAPDLALGRELYARSCASCHGPDGRAAVPLAKTLEPPPTNFHDPGAMAGLTAYRAFNAIRFGVPGTAMAGLPALSEEQRWSLAFYLFTLRQPPCEGTPPRASLEQLATLTDPQLAQAFGGEAQLPCLRQELPQADEGSALASARADVERALRLGQQGDLAGARLALLDAYLKGVEPAEATLRLRSPGLVQELEAGFLRARYAAEQRQPEALQREARALLASLDKAQQTSAPTFLSVFWLALLILLREGFEATLIVAALLAVLQKLQAPAQARLVHAGWVCALAVGALAFLFGRQLLAGANQELMEGITALVAVAMLLYSALWLNARAHVSQFMGELRQKMQGALGRGSRLGLFVISFSAVLRESFETAVFLQGLAVDSVSAVLWGVAAGALLLTALVLFVRRVGYRLPMKALFQVSTALMVATAVILLGKGLHALQEVAVLPLSPLPFVQVDFLGIYPDALSLVPQLLLALAPLAYRALARRRSAAATSPPPR
ncbi:MAG TPA: cytochrome c/FTR1 family iron permease [Aggregicoccus sp.]|nr:cytochrome c/FTR1 family iron permease [Aggregicoccus sp.]